MRIVNTLAIALATYQGHMTATGPDFSDLPTLKLILDIGVASLKLMLSVLAGYIAYSIAGRPGLVPGGFQRWPGADRIICTA